MNEPFKRKVSRRPIPEFNRPIEVEEILAEILDLREFKNSAGYKYLYHPLDNDTLEILFAKRFVTFLPNLYRSLQENLTNHYFIRLLKYTVKNLAQLYETKYIGVSIVYGPNLNFEDPTSQHQNIIDKIHLLTQCIFSENEELDEHPITEYINATEPIQYDNIEGNFIYNLSHSDTSKNLENFKFLNISSKQLGYIYKLSKELFEETFNDLIIPSFFDVKRGLKEALLFLNDNKEVIEDIKLIPPKFLRALESAGHTYNLDFSFLTIRVKTNKNIHAFHLSFTNMDWSKPPYPYKFKDKLEFFWWGLLNRKIVDIF